jgi:hypothetical protein
MEIVAGESPEKLVNELMTATRFALCGRYSSTWKKQLPDYPIHSHEQE